MNGITDSHTHLLPGKLAQKVRQFFLNYLTDNQLLVYPLEHKTVLDALYAVGISTVWSLPYAHKAGVAEGLNASSAETVKEYADHPVKIIGGATVHPFDVDSATIIETAVKTHGLKVLKLHSSVGNFLIDDPLMNPVWETVSAYRMPVIAHIGKAVSGSTFENDLPPLEKVCQQFPNARIIVAHSGYPSADQVFDLMRKHPNLHADLTPAIFYLPEFSKESLLELQDRILFGTDAPNTGILAEKLIAHVQSWQLGESAEAAIFGGNAHRLLSEMSVL
jgi:uncharacterized protein